MSLFDGQCQCGLVNVNVEWSMSMVDSQWSMSVIDGQCQNGWVNAKVDGECQWRMSMVNANGQW